MPRVSSKKSKRRLSKRLTATLVVAGLVVVGFGAFTLINNKLADAAGASTCGNNYKWYYTGRLGDSQKGGTYPAEVRLYKDTKAKRLCALLLSTGSAKGVKKFMGVKWDRSSVKDEGYFKSYAGPIYIKMRDYTSCPFAFGTMSWKGKSVSYKNASIGRVAGSSEQCGQKQSR